MRWLVLYLRSRRVPLALTLTVAAIAMVWALWLAYAESTTVNARTVTLTVVIAVAALVPTLSGADDALDHTASINWPLRRAGQRGRARGREVGDGGDGVGEYGPPGQP